MGGMLINISRKNPHTVEGRWETLPFQRAIMNAMGSDYIREVNVVKFRPCWLFQMLLGVYAYFIEHMQHTYLVADGW